MIEEEEEEEEEERRRSYDWILLLPFVLESLLPTPVLTLYV